jgi:hypothetical protein
MDGSVPALRPVHHLRRTALTAALLVASALAPTAASAQTPIAVKACGSSEDLRTDAWVRSATTSQPIDFIDRCGDTLPASVGNVNVTGAYGFTASPASAGLTAQPGRIAGYTITAPTDAMITALDSHYAMTIDSADWEIRFRSGGTVIATCAGPTTVATCADGVTNRIDAPIPVPAPTKSLDVGVYCVAAIQCTYGGGPNPTFSLVIADATVTVADTTPPTASTPTTSGQINGRLTSEGLVSVGGSDTTGVQLLEVLEGTEVVGEHEGRCVDWSMRPCAEPSIGAGSSLGAVFTVEELGLKSGTHTLVTRVTDPAGNTTLSDPITIIVDETVGAASNITGGGRSNAPTREVGWTMPAGMTVTQTKVELCTNATGVGQGSNCSLITPTGLEGPVQFASETFPNVTVRVRLTSAGGAVTYSDPVDYVYDIVEPKQPKLKLVEATGDLRTVELIPDPADTDAAAYTAYLCPAPSNKCAPASSGTLPGPGGAPIRVSTRLTSLANVRVDISVIDAAGNVSLPGQLILSPTAKDLGITVNATPMAIAPKLPSKLPKGSLLVRGSTQPGAAAQVMVTIAGRGKKNKAVKLRKAAKITRGTGAFAVRFKLPKGFNRKKGALITIDASPNKGWLGVKSRVRLKG